MAYGFGYLLVSAWLLHAIWLWEISAIGTSNQALLLMTSLFDRYVHVYVFFILFLWHSSGLGTMVGHRGLGYYPATSLDAPRVTATTLDVLWSVHFQDEVRLNSTLQVLCGGWGRRVSQVCVEYSR